MTCPLGFLTHAAGVYAIEHAGGGATKLAYELELPQEPGEAQRELNIGKRAAFLVSIKAGACRA